MVELLAIGLTAEQCSAIVGCAHNLERRALAQKFADSANTAPPWIPQWGMFFVAKVRHRGQQHVTTTSALAAYSRPETDRSQPPLFTTSSLNEIERYLRRDCDEMVVTFVTPIWLDVAPNNTAMGV